MLICTHTHTHAQAADCGTREHSGGRFAGRGRGENRGKPGESPHTYRDPRSVSIESVVLEDGGFVRVPLGAKQVWQRGVQHHVVELRLLVRKGQAEVRQRPAHLPDRGVSGLDAARRRGRHQRVAHGDRQVRARAATLGLGDGGRGAAEIGAAVVVRLPDAASVCTRGARAQVLVNALELIQDVGALAFHGARAARADRPRLADIRPRKDVCAHTRAAPAYVCL